MDNLVIVKVIVILEFANMDIANQQEIVTKVQQMDTHHLPQIYAMGDIVVKIMSVSQRIASEILAANVNNVQHQQRHNQINVQVSNVQHMNNAKDI